MILMNLITSMLVMGAIGAFLGASTNHLAIKMLFRPYNPVFIGKWQLPFTPGLIPKRRDQLAISLGETVTKYLLTPEMFRKKFMSSEVHQTVLNFVQEKVEQEVFHSNKTIQQWVDLAGVQNLSTTVENKVDDVIVMQFESMKNTLSTKSINELLPLEIQKLVENKIPVVIEQILLKGEDYFTSEAGTATIKNMLDDFLSSKGSFGGMIQMFVGDGTAIVEKIQKELVKFLQAPGTTQLLETMITSEWDKLKQLPVMDFLTEIEFEPMIENVQGYVKQQLAIETRLDKTIRDYWPQGNDWAKQTFIPKLVDNGFKQASNKLEGVLHKLNIKELVREQVDSFPVQQLEDLVLGISKKELRMITYLGGFIGAFIGIIQGLLVFFTN